MAFINKNIAKILILVGIAFAIFAFVVGGPSPSSRNRLTETHEGINWIYRQNRESTAEERKAGMVALKKWKSANGYEKNRLASDIVLSKVLIGLTQLEIVEYMGTPDAFGAVDDIAPNIRATGYNACDRESQCDLMIELNEDGKASDVYLDVNY
jgi:hypothetical protein